MSILLITIMLLPCGCWDRIEPDIIGLVTMIAFDLDEEAGLFRVYAQLANPVGAARQQEGGGGNQARSAIWALQATGHTVFQAIKNMELRSTRRLIFSHVEIVLFSETLARRGIRPVLDYIEREPQIRLIARPLVVQGDLEKLMQAQFPLEKSGAKALSKQVVSVREETAHVSATETVKLMLRSLSIPGQELELPRLVVLTEDKPKENEAAAAQNPALISGLAVFRGDRLAGFFDNRETAGYMWLISKIKLHYLVLRCPAHEEKLLGVEIYESRAKITPQINGNEVRFRVTIFADGRLQEFACEDLPPDTEYLASLNRRLATAIRNEAAASLERGRELGTDVFGLGNAIYRTRNREWQRFGANWQEIFPEVMVDLEVEAVIRRHGLSLAPITIR